MNINDFVYADYATAVYAPEISAVMIYDEIAEDAIQFIPAETEAQAGYIMFLWWINRPKDCLCFTMM